MSLQKEHGETKYENRQAADDDELRWESFFDESRQKFLPRSEWSLAKTWIV